MDLWTCGAGVRTDPGYLAESPDQEGGGAMRSYIIRLVIFMLGSLEITVKLYR
jgi:hypothetical protein